MSPAPSDWERLRGALSGAVQLHPPESLGLASDASGLVGRVDAVVRPEGPEDLQRLIAWARDHRTPVVARGAGTSLDGESVPTHGGVVVDFSGWDRILEIDPVEGIACVQPGVANRRLDRELRALRLTYPPNPGSGLTSTIGGNAATNASGPRSYRYGPTRAWVRALELVDGRGERWRAGGRWAKASIGPDLVGLLVGSEGTLGLFTEVTVRVAPLPERRTGLVVPVPPDRPLGGFVRDLAEALGPEASALEYVDRTTAGALRETAGRDWPSDRGLLLAEVEGGPGAEEAALARVEALAERAQVPGEVAVYPDAERLWEIRGAAGPSLERVGGPGLREDVVVPIARLDAMLGEVERLAAAEGVALRVFGHIGQGNLHPVFVVDPRSAAAERLRRGLADAALRHGGAISGEHGIGATKRADAPRQLGAPAIALLRALKATLDPLGILNPGKLLPDPPAPPGPPPSGSPSAGAAPRTPSA